MQVTIGIDPQPTRLIEALRIIAQHATSCADELEALVERNKAEDAAGAGDEEHIV